MRDIIVNGYTYPTIDPGVLETALPSLTYLAFFSYGITEDGDLIQLDDQFLIELARGYGTASLMVLTALNESGTFDSEQASRLFSNPDLQDRAIDQIILTLQEKGMYGIDFDYEYIFPESSQDYVAFMAKTAQRLHEYGYIVTAAVAPKVSDNQPGLLYQGHDYYGIGQVADYVMLMTYEWGYTYGPPMAVAPLDQVRRVVEYAVTRIPEDKILLGIPNYGYDWALPYIQGETVARGLGNLEAEQIAENIGAEIMFDEVAQSPYFEYVDANGISHIIWFENAESITAKLSLIEEYNLAGAGYWNVMRVFPANWLILNSMYNVIKVI